MRSGVEARFRIVGCVDVIRTRIRRVAAGLLLCLIAWSCGEPPGEPSPPVPTAVLREEVPAGRTDTLPHPAARHPLGSRILRVDKTPPRVLTEGLAAAGAPVASLDGEQILFTGKASERKPYGLWACRLDGGDRRRLVVEDLDCGVGAWLPDGGLVYARALAEPGPVAGMQTAWALFGRGPTRTGAGASRSAAATSTRPCWTTGGSSTPPGSRPTAGGCSCGPCTPTGRAPRGCRGITEATRSPSSRAR